ncbi:GTP-binding protein [Pseudactinotalea sp.]|uniref:GTP-binding protein n=1 Tax=Pseudactinotalea sp. TaxID=1926260 RepID=UPI003B3B011A
MFDTLVPLAVLASTDPIERDVAIMTALVDAPGYVAIVHELLPDSSGEPELIRRVVTPSGESRVTVPLEHACAGCAMREDAVPAIVEQLDEHPRGIVLALPIGAELLPATRTLSAAVRCGALNGTCLVGTTAVVAARHLLDALDDGDDAVVAQLIGAATIIAPGGGRAARDVIDALRSPSSSVLSDACAPWLSRAVSVTHDDEELERICDPETMGRGHGMPRAEAMPDGTMVAPSGVWEMELHSELPFHPGRLLHAVRTMGALGAVSRGRFWLPNRPDSVCGWESVSGQVCIGVAGAWAGEHRQTYMTVIGYDTDPSAIRSAFAAALLTPREHAAGLTPWLGQPDPLAQYLGEPAG